MNIHVLIVDDEPPARSKIRALLKGKKEVSRISEAGDGIEAVRLIKETSPHIVFLDIQMPGMSGFEVIEEIGAGDMPEVVFVTAYDQYAIDAFEVRALDYLLKPFHRDRFEKAFQRALEQITSGAGQTGDSSPVKQLLEHLHSTRSFLDRLMVKKGDRYFFVKTEEIRHISAEEKYVKLHCGTETFLLRETMTHMEEKLNPVSFVRIHRSYIVNMDYIKEVQPWTHGDYVVILHDGQRLNMSRRYSERLLQKF